VLIDDETTIEQKQDISGKMGEGISLLISEGLFNVDKTTITRINRSGLRPDFKGFHGKRTVIWEAKGSLNSIEDEIRDHAKRQIEIEQADVAFISLAELKADCMSEVGLEDPEPELPLDGSSLDIELAKVRHYVDAFNFIGQAKLSRYFELLGIRLEKDQKFLEFDEKIRLFQQLKNESPKIHIEQRNYLGNIERIRDNIYLFVGFDENLLSVYSFLNYNGYENDLIKENLGNAFIVTRDGICYGYIINLDQLITSKIIERINTKKIPYYMDKFSIRDLDSMYDFQLVEYIRYLFKREKSIFILDNNGIDKQSDFTVEINKKKYIPKVRIPYPKDKAVQKQIVDKINAVIITARELHEQVTEIRQKAINLFKSYYSFTF
jgi:hypothetical protein